MTPEELFEQHLPWATGIARSCHRHLPPSFDLEDLIQEAHAALWKCAQQFDPDYGVEFLCYAHPYVQGACWMSVRRRSYREATHAALEEARPAEAAVEADFEGDVLDREALELALRSVRRLSPLHRTIIRRHYVAGAPMTTIAAGLGMSLTAVYVERQKAIEALRDAMRLRRPRAAVA